MHIPPTGSGPHIVSVGAEGGGEGNLFPLGGAQARNSNEIMDTRTGQFVEEAETQNSTGCMTRCFSWLRRCLNQAEKVAEEAESIVEEVESLAEEAGSLGEAEKPYNPGIPKPDSPGEKVDLKTLESKTLKKLSLEKAIETAIKALENAKKTACFEYWAYEDSVEPRNRTKVDEAQGVLEKATALVRSFISQKRKETTFFVPKLILLNLLTDECEVLHVKIAEKLDNPDPAVVEEDTNAAESRIGLGRLQVIERTTKL